MTVTRFKGRRGTAAQAAAANEVLLAGEYGAETDTGLVKLGNGVTAWNELPYLNRADGVAFDDSGLVVVEGSTTVQQALAALDAGIGTAIAAEVERANGAYAAAPVAVGEVLHLAAYDLDSAMPASLNPGTSYNTHVGTFRGFDEAYEEPAGEWVTWDMGTGVVTIATAGLYRVALSAEGVVGGSTAIVVLDLVLSSTYDSKDQTYSPASINYWLVRDTVAYLPAGATIGGRVSNSTDSAGSLSVDYVELFIEKVG